MRPRREVCRRTDGVQPAAAPRRGGGSGGRGGQSRGSRGRTGGARRTAALRQGSQGGGRGGPRAAGGGGGGACKGPCRGGERRAGPRVKIARLHEELVDGAMARSQVLQAEESARALEAKRVKAPAGHASVRTVARRRAPGRNWGRHQRTALRLKTSCQGEGEGIGRLRRGGRCRGGRRRAGGRQGTLARQPVTYGTASLWRWRRGRGAWDSAVRPGGGRGARGRDETGREERGDEGMRTGDGAPKKTFCLRRIAVAARTRPLESRRGGARD